MRRVQAFMDEALPGVPARDRAFAADLVMTTMTAVGKKISEQHRPAAEVDAWAMASAEMYCGYLVSLTRRRARAR
jgi:hypothetical protein